MHVNTCPKQQQQQRSGELMNKLSTQETHEIQNVVFYVCKEICIQLVKSHDDDEGGER